MFKLSSFFINTLRLSPLIVHKRGKDEKSIIRAAFLFLNSECRVTFASPCTLVLGRWAPCSSSEELTVNSEFVPEVERFAVYFRDERWFDPDKCSCSVLPGLHWVLICQVWTVSSSEMAMDMSIIRSTGTHPVHIGPFILIHKSRSNRCAVENIWAE